MTKVCYSITHLGYQKPYQNLKILSTDFQQTFVAWSRGIIKDSEETVKPNTVKLLRDDPSVIGEQSRIEFDFMFLGLS